MTGAQRDYLRAAVDEHVRAERARLLAQRGPFALACRGCGCDLDTRTIGCKVCYDRIGSRVRTAKRHAARRAA